jgi:Ca2+-binding EF-hand superfamily protein
MNLYKCDDSIFNRITVILDENEDGVIECEELIERISDI